MPEEKELPPTLDEVLGDKFDEILSRDEVKEEPAKVGGDEPEVKPLPETEPKEEAKGRKRGADGKFTKEEGAENATPPEEIADKGKEGKLDAVAKAISKPPASWSAEAKARWEELSPEIRAEAHRLEKATQQLVAKNAEARKQYEGLEQILAPRRGKLAAMYGSEARAIEQLFALSDFAEKDPQGFLRYFAQQRGLNLASLGAQAPQIDPNIAALQQQIQALQGEIQQSKQSQQQSLHSEADRQLQAFVNDPKNIYLDDVREDMARLLEAGLASDYQDAYDRAVWANPSTREKINLERSRAENEKRQKEAEEKAKEAKRINATNVATKGVMGVSPNKPTSIDETLERTWNALHGAA